MKLASHPHFWRIGGLLAVDALVFGLSDPHKVPSFMLAAGFVLLVVTLYQLIYGVLLIANWYGVPGGTHRHRQARILTGIIGGLAALQSIGELGVRDVLVALPLAVVAYLYISYGRGGEARQQAAAPFRGPSSTLSATD